MTRCVAITLLLSLLLCSGCAPTVGVAVTLEKQKKTKKKKKKQKLLLAAAQAQTAPPPTTPPPTEPPTEPPPGSGKRVQITWDPPTDSSGRAPVNLAGYRILRGPGPRQYDTIVDVPNSSSTTHVLDVPPGFYYFTMTAYYGPEATESGYSNEVSIAIP